VRERSATFADHYSQARQFYLSQTKWEPGHIADALIFELSKVERAAIRVRLVSHLPHIDAKLADRVAKGLGLREKINLTTPAQEPVTDLAPSPALSILRNGPKSFAGRKVGVLVTDGTDRQVSMD
jgi:catalase